MAQPGGWIYNSLPYMEQQAVHDLQVGKTGSSRLDAATQMIQTPLWVMSCPTRRPAILYPIVVMPEQPNSHQQFCFTNAVSMVARSDYAGNGGDVFSCADSFGSIFMYYGPKSIAEAESAAGVDSFGTIAANSTGIFYPGSEIGMDQLPDGASNTYLFGEKYLSSDNYANGQDNGDNEAMYIGDNSDIIRWTSTGWSAPSRPAGRLYMGHFWECPRQRV